MQNKEQIIKKINKPEDKLFVSRLLDKVQRAEKQRILTYSDFLDPHQKLLAEMIFLNSGSVKLYFNGGYPEAERTIAFFIPDFMDVEEHKFPSKQIFSYLKLTVGTNKSLSHRDYLGSLMSIGIKREKTGDILVSEGVCFLIVLKDISDYIKYNLEKVSNLNVAIEEITEDELVIPELNIKEIKTTVPSLRLDSVSASGFRMSRSKIVDLIRAEKLNLNWEMTDNISRQIKEGDTISIKGKGKIVLEKIDGKSRKDRFFITIKRFV